MRPSNHDRTQGAAVKVLLSWLREFAPGIDGAPDALSDALSALGLTVEEMTLTGRVPSGIVLGEVVGLRPHPAADRIQLVDVDDGSGDLLQVCCGAFNMKSGDLIGFARPGVRMPDGLKIRRRRIRGQMSAGMCCSEAELGMGDDASGILILNDRVEPGAEPGTGLAEALGIAPDVLWDLDVSANRPDAMSVMGVARDLAAKLKVAFEPPDWSPEETSERTCDALSVEIADPTLCGRFSARLLRGVSVAASPAWLANRLTLLGMRPVNSIVDISNYVMLELGQPSHAFDLARLPDGVLRVRRATHGERLVTLDGAERVLHEGDGVIADGLDRVIGIAGIIGGESTAISERTSDVALEMAWWDPPSVSRTAKRLNLASEAATRFRRGMDWGDNIDRCFRRFAQLAAASGASLASGTVEALGDLPDRSPLRVRTARVNGLLGTALSDAEIAGHLRSIGFEVSQDAHGDGAEAPDGAFSVVIPTWRWDTATETDIAEEVARLHGYENIERTLPLMAGAGGLTSYQQARRTVRDVLAGAGCDEIQPMPFLAPGDLAAVGLPENGITLSNPLDERASVMRTSLLPGCLKALAYNQRHFNTGMRFFEIGHVFMPPAAGQLLPDEREHLGVALSDAGAPDAVAVMSLLEQALALPGCRLRAAEPPGMHPTRSAETVIAGRVRGVVGEIDPAVLEAWGVTGRLAWLQLDLGRVLHGLRGSRRYRRVSKFPPSTVDLAFVVPDGVPAAELERAIRTGGGALLASAELFDVYRGPGLPNGARSLAYRLKFQAPDRTLTDAEVAQARNNCITEARRRLGAVLRG